MLHQDPLLTIDQAAALLAMHPQTVRKMVRQRELAAIRRSQRGYIKIRVSELQRWIRSKEMPRSRHEERQAS